MALNQTTQALLDDASNSLAQTQAADQKVTDLQGQMTGLQTQLNTGLQDQTDKHRTSNEKLVAAMRALATDFNFPLPADFPGAATP
jgi:hypothetical protein